MPALRPALVRSMRTGPTTPGKAGGLSAVLPPITQLDLHAEYQRADFAFAMAEPAEAARILERVVEAEPSNQAAARARTVVP